jgi:hypothetical protein
MVSRKASGQLKRKRGLAHATLEINNANPFGHSVLPALQFKIVTTGLDLATSDKSLAPFAPLPLSSEPFPAPAVAPDTAQ